MREGDAIANLTPVTLDKRAITVVLFRLARKQGRARDLYSKLMGSWGHRPDRQRVTVKLGEQEFQVLEGLNLPDGLVSLDVLPSGWVTLYRHPRYPELEVKVKSKQKPPKRRTFRVGGKKRQLVAVSYHRIGKNPKEAKVATRTKKKKEEDLEDELEGLEDLEDLDDEDLEDEEEPDDEDEEDEDEEDEEPAPKKGKAATRKKAPAKGKAKSTTRKRKAAEPEEEDEDEDEDEDEAPAKKTSKKASGKSSTKTTAKSSAKSSGTKGKAKNGNLPATRELPKGQLGPADIAEMVGGECDSRYVRIYLRENYERPEGGRWAFSKSDARSIAKEIKAQRKKNA